MSAIERLRQARSVDQLADEIEPLAQSLALLADDARAALSETLSQAQAQAGLWSQQQSQTATQWQQTAQTVAQTAQRLENATQQARWLIEDRNWRLWIGVAITALIVGVVAPSVYGLWRNHYSATAQDAQNWQNFVQTYQALPPDKRKVIDRIMGWNRN
jgi:ElaB/YqjD/DUF883 family membrane-anchored ribosome-binding protein